MAKKDSQSQLKRLKSALRESGISRDQKAKGPRKSRVDREKELSKIRDKFNPYETQINKSKFAVGGRKLKGTEGRPGASAAIAEKMRQETIGRERERRGRVGGVLDRRFGEGRADLTPEQIQLERYTRERQKGKRRNNFSLEEEDEGEGLTHLGQSLSAMDDFGPAPMSDDEDMGAEMVSRTNFGGFEETQLEEDEIIGEDGEKRKKTKAEIMQEIIAKSKKGKYERQRQAEEDDEAREELDADLEDLQMLLNESQASKPKSSDGVNSDRMKAIQEDSAYDKAVKELIYDRRAQASERTKTEEELIEEEAKRLHEQEEARIKRMRGEEPDEPNAHDKKRKRTAQGDDLSDDFQSESGSDDESDVGEFGVGVNAGASQHVTLEDDDPESSTEGETDDEDEVEDGTSLHEDTFDPSLKPGMDIDEDDDAEEESDSADDDDDDDEDDDEDDEELPSEELIAAAKAELARREALGTASPAPLKSALKPSRPIAVTTNPGELKFTYPCPATLDQLLTITSPLSETDVPTALHRIRVLHHPRLNPANNDKLSKYLTTLIDYVLSEDVFDSVRDYCTGQIHELSQKYWEPSTLHFLELLEQVRQAMYRDMARPFTVRELRYFSLIGQVWSTSDAYHKVATPAFLVASQYLAQNSADSERALATKVVLCSILTHWVRESKRYVPEVVACLRSTLATTLEAASAADAAPTTLQLGALETASRASIHDAAQKVVMRLAGTYLSSVAFPDIFRPMVSLVTSAEVRGQLERSIANALRARRPLSLQTHRPIPLASLVPKFEENFSLDKKSYDRDGDRAADSKMKAELRDARRGAVRVLRRDAAFEARENAKDRRTRDAAYRQKITKVENRLRQKDA